MILTTSDQCEKLIKHHSTAIEYLRKIRDYHNYKVGNLESVTIAQRKYNELTGVSVDMADVHEMD